MKGDAVARSYETPPRGLPIGVQVIGPYLEDRTAIDVAGMLDELTGGFRAPGRTG